MSYYTIAKPEVICKSHYLVVVVFVCLFVCFYSTHACWMSDDYSVVVQIFP